MIILHSFVGVDEDVLDINLFRHFLRYHREVGVDRIEIDLQSNVGDGARIDAFVRIARDYGAEINDIVHTPYVGAGNHLDYMCRFVARHTGRGDWLLLADVDEFAAIPRPFPDFFRKVDAKGCNIVLGELLDRFAVSDQLPPVDPIRSLDEQFPYAYPLTSLVRRGWTRKVVAFKGPMTPIPGHHAMQEEGGFDQHRRYARYLRRIDRWTGPPLRDILRRIYFLTDPKSTGIRPYSRRIDVHHFAWDGLLAAKMKKRVKTDSKDSAEMLRVLRFVEDPGRLLQLRSSLLRHAVIGA